MNWKFINFSWDHCAELNRKNQNHNIVPATIKTRIKTKRNFLLFQKEAVTQEKNSSQ